MENNKYPKNFHKLFLKQSKRKSHNQTVNSKNKTCKKFCEKKFLPQRERVEMEFAKRNKMKYYV